MNTVWHLNKIYLFTRFDKKKTLPDSRKTRRANLNMLKPSCARTGLRLNDEQDANHYSHSTRPGGTTIINKKYQFTHIKQARYIGKVRSCNSIHPFLLKRHAPWKHKNLLKFSMIPRKVRTQFTIYEVTWNRLLPMS